MREHNIVRSASLLLKGSAIVFCAIGISLIIWFTDNAIHHPEITASQFGREAPLWIPMILFTVISCISIVVLFFRTARRLASINFREEEEVAS